MCQPHYYLIPCLYYFPPWGSKLPTGDTMFVLFANILCGAVLGKYSVSVCWKNEGHLIELRIFLSSYKLIATATCSNKIREFVHLLNEIFSGLQVWLDLGIWPIASGIYFIFLLCWLNSQAGFPDIVAKVAVDSSRLISLKFMILMKRLCLFS